MATAQDTPTTDGMIQALLWFKNEISNEIDAKIALMNGGALNAIEGVSVDGTIQPVKNKIAMLGMSAYAKKTDVASGYHYKGSVNNFSDLPNTGMNEGDMYNILVAGGTDMNGDEIKAGDNVAWTGKGWDVLSGMVDLSQCVMKTPGKDLSTNDFTDALKKKLDGLTNSTYTLPTASKSTKGGVKVGDGLKMDGDTLNVTMVAAPSYIMPTASTTTKGGVKVGHGLQMQGETLNALASSYTLPTASANMKGGVKVGKGLQMNGDTLEAVAPPQYTLPTASKSTKGGVKVGDGLKMDGDTLSVTLQSGDKYDAFEGATANFAGTSGLVPSPAGGDNTKFLRGDGTWAHANQNVTIVTGAVTVAPTPQTIDGALWEDSLSNGDPCLKMRYGDYEFNFKHDTKNYTGSTKPFTPEDAQLYMLDTVPSTDEGTLWYNVTQSTYFPIPALCLHAGDYDYGYNYDTITYKGGNTDLYSYLPLQQSTTDALGKTWTTGLAAGMTAIVLESFKVGSVTYRGLRGVVSTSNNADAITGAQILKHTCSLPKSTVDFWITIPATSTPFKAVVPLKLIYGNSNRTVQLNNTGLLMNDGYAIKEKFLTTGSSATYRKHIAFVHDGATVYAYADGVFIQSQATTGNLNSVVLFESALGNKATNRIYIDHFRIWNKVVWGGDFEVPKMSDY